MLAHQQENTAQIFSSIPPSGSFLWVTRYFGLSHQPPQDKMHHVEHWPNDCRKDMAMAHKMTQVLKLVQGNIKKTNLQHYLSWMEIFGVRSFV